MTTLQIKSETVTLNDNRLIGNTYPIKEYIKTYLGGRWDSNTKSWTIDTNKVNNLIAKNAIIIVAAPVVATSAPSNGYCHKCHSYCYGDCES